MTGKPAQPTLIRRTCQNLRRHGTTWTIWWAVTRFEDLLWEAVWHSHEGETSAL